MSTFETLLSLPRADIYLTVPSSPVSIVNARRVQASRLSFPSPSSFRLLFFTLSLTFDSLYAPLGLEPRSSSHLRSTGLPNRRRCSLHTRLIIRRSLPPSSPFLPPVCIVRNFKSPEILRAILFTLPSRPVVPKAPFDSSLTSLSSLALIPFDFRSLEAHRFAQAFVLLDMLYLTPPCCVSEKAASADLGKLRRVDLPFPCFASEGTLFIWRASELISAGRMPSTDSHKRNKPQAPTFPLSPLSVFSPSLARARQILLPNPNGHPLSLLSSSSQCYGSLAPLARLSRWGFSLSSCSSHSSSSPSGRDRRRELSLTFFDGEVEGMRVLVRWS